MRIRRFSTDRVRSHHSRRRSLFPTPPSKWKPRTSRRFPKFPERLSASPPSFPRPSSSPYLSPLCLSAFLSQYIPPRVCATLPLPRATPPPLRADVQQPRWYLRSCGSSRRSPSPSTPCELSSLRRSFSLAPWSFSTRSSVLLAPDERFSQTRSAHSLGRFYLRFSFFPISSVSSLPPTVLGSICLPSQLGVPQRSGGLAD